MTLRLFLSALLSFVCLGATSLAAQEVTLQAESQGAFLTRGTLHLKVTASNLPDQPLDGVVLANGREIHRFQLSEGEQTVSIEKTQLGGGSHAIVVQAGAARAETSVRAIPGWLSLTPPLIAIIIALILKDVLIALFSGVFIGALILYNWNPVTAFARSIDSIIVPALANGDHVKIVIFSMLLGGMVGLISKSGGTLGIVERIKGFATTARRGQLATWFMGILIFFDDYANCLIVGSTMRPITDRLRISREKLAYMVDSTAAPVASVFPISTWIGFEVGLIGAAFTQLNLPFNAYLAFIDSIPFRFYPIFALVLGFTIAVTCRDLGPMLKAERRASTTGLVVGENDVPLADYGASALAPPPGIPHRAINAFLPIVTVIVATVVGMYVSGASTLDRNDYPALGAWLREVFSNASSLNVLLWSSLLALVVAAVLPLAQRILTLRQMSEGMTEGFKAMLLAIIVLVLAWSIGEVVGQLHTADYVVAFARNALSPHFLPVLVFIIAAVISFATGTSWGTMAILMPLVIPIADGLSIAAGHPAASAAYYTFMMGTISSVLAGSVWGDHCSPISDTTILSSMGAGSDHIAHVKTQLPYAFAIGILGMLVGDIPTAYGLPAWVSILVGTVVIVAVVRIFGKRSDWTGADAAN